MISLLEVFLALVCNVPKEVCCSQPEAYHLGDMLQSQCIVSFIVALFL